MVQRCLLIVIACIAAGCSTFPHRPPLIGYDPAPYGDAFRAAAMEAVVRRETGRGFYEVFADKAYTLGSQGRCDDKTLQQFLTQQRGCWLLSPADHAGCRESDLCLEFTADRRILEQPAIRRAVDAALLRPCDTLTAPDDLPYARWPSIIGKSALSSWRVLGCGGRRPVVGENLVWSGEGDRIRITLRFRQGR